MEILACIVILAVILGGLYVLYKLPDWFASNVTASNRRGQPGCPHHNIVWGSEMRCDNGNWYCKKCGEPI